MRARLFFPAVGARATERPLRAVIADDEPRARQFLERLLGEHEGLEVVGVARNGAEALAMVQEHRPDVAFLDIHMPDISGLEVARHLGAAAPLVVFVTAYDQHAVEAFELAALDYVLKPIRRDRLSETVRRVIHEVRTRDNPARGQERAIDRVLDAPGVDVLREPLRRLPVRHRREVRLLDLAGVTRIVSRDRLVLACAEGHEFLVDYTLQELEERLPRGQFVRVHRGALVNVDSIESYGGEDGVLVLKLKDGTRVEASERRAADVRRRLK
ncbi:MAG: response regulator transcription factor [Candidatus Eisenbacteria bacterium]|uniref:Response regulator transcription factor n=1 Tax=Eiseniibacteriota bacterium TaxID=2212470 RepID=A0A849SH64_UNCEI|nr:response regulator transcription factor [Candidatus Eisenbacteria bacterium]